MTRNLRLGPDRGIDPERRLEADSRSFARRTYPNELGAQQSFELRKQQDARGAERDENHRRENQEKDGEDEFDGDLAGFFLSGLAEAGSQITGMGAERGAEGGAEAVGIDQDQCEFFDFGVAGAGDQVAQGFLASGVGSKLQA